MLGQVSWWWLWSRSQVVVQWEDAFRVPRSLALSISSTFLCTQSWKSWSDDWRIFSWIELYSCLVCLLLRMFALMSYNLRVRSLTSRMGRLACFLFGNVVLAASRTALHQSMYSSSVVFSFSSFDSSLSPDGALSNFPTSALNFSTWVDGVWAGALDVDRRGANAV